MCAGKADDTRLRQAIISGAIMTFEANSEDDGPPQKFAVHRAVGGVTRFAASDANRGVFEDEWPPFILMAFDTRFFIARDLIHQTGFQADSPR